MTRPSNTLLVAAGIIAGVLLAANLHRGALARGEGRLAQVRAEIAGLRSGADQGSTRARLALLQTQAERCAGLIPAQSTTAELLTALKRDFAGLGVASPEWGIGSAQPSGSQIEIPIDLTFEGSFPSTHEFLRLIGAYERIIRIEKLVCMTQPDSPADQLSVAIRLCVLAQPDHPGAESGGDAR